MRKAATKTNFSTFSVIAGISVVMRRVVILSWDSGNYWKCTKIRFCCCLSHTGVAVRRICRYSRFLKKRSDRFPWNLSWFIGVICRRERIKTSRKFRPLMCKTWGNGAKWPILSPHGPRALACAMACGPSSRARLRACLRSDFGTGQSRADLGRSPLPSMGDRIKRLCAPEFSSVVPLPGASLCIQSMN